MDGGQRREQVGCAAQGSVLPAKLRQFPVALRWAEGRVTTGVGQAGGSWGLEVTLGVSAAARRPGGVGSGPAG